MSKSTAKRKDLLYSDKDHCISVYGNIILSFSLQPPNPSYLKAWTNAMDRLVGETHGPIAIVTIIDSRAKAPDEPSKKAIRDTIAKHAARTCAFVYVVEGTGFGAAAMRSALSLISLAARYPFPQKVFAKVAEASAWTAQRLPANAAAEISATEIASAVETMRYRLQRLAAAG